MSCMTTIAFSFKKGKASMKFNISPVPTPQYKSKIVSSSLTSSSIKLKFLQEKHELNPKVKNQI